MDNEDKEFESFLSQFELRQHRQFPQAVPPQEFRKTRRWILAAAAVAVISILSFALLRNFSRVGSPGTVVEAAGDSSYTAGETVSRGRVIRSGGLESLTLKLEDGTRVEMRAQSELSMDSAEDGIRVRLNGGSILVIAAKQRAGHLYVETPDTVASVVGTVFFVERTSLGTRVGVCEGEVEVRQGLKLRKLIPGQQVSTDPAMEGSLVEAIAWSSRASSLIALLPSIAVTQQEGTPAPEKEPKKDPPASPKPASPKKDQQSKPEMPPSPPAPEPTPRKAPREEPPAAQNPPAPSDAGADGPAIAILNRECGACHVANLGQDKRFASKEEVASLVSRQIAYGAQLSPSEAQVLVDYLFKTYGLAH